MSHKYRSLWECDNCGAKEESAGLDEPRGWQHSDYNSDKIPDLCPTCFKAVRDAQRQALSSAKKETS